MPNDRRGAKARAEMGPKGYLQVLELAEKLTTETGKNVTASMLKAYRVRGRIQGVLHRESNCWFFHRDTKLPERMPMGGSKKRGPDEPMLLGVWAIWPPPGYVRMGQRSYRVWGRGSLGWFGG